MHQGLKIVMKSIGRALKHLISLEVKQEEATKNCAMKACVVIPSHFGCGGELGATWRLTKWHTIIIIPCSSLLLGQCVCGS